MTSTRARSSCSTPTTRRERPVSPHGVFKDLGKVKRTIGRRGSEPGHALLQRVYRGPLCRGTTTWMVTTRIGTLTINPASSFVVGLQRVSRSKTVSARCWTKPSQDFDFKITLRLRRADFATSISAEVTFSRTGTERLSQRRADRRGGRHQDLPGRGEHLHLVHVSWRSCDSGH